MSVTFVRHADKYAQSVDPHIKPGVYTLNVPYNVIITSPYLRCRETANMLNTLQKPIYVDVRISEYQTHPYANNTLDPSTLQWGNVPLKESWQQVAQRLDSFLEYLREFTKVYGDTLVVTHGVVVNYMHEKIYGTKMYARGRDVPFVSGFTVSNL